MNLSRYGNYRTRSFSDIFGDAETFLNEWKDSGVYENIIKDTSITRLFYLLYSRYGNSHIASSDENRFKYNVFSIIWQYGPSWEKRVDIQKKLRDISDADLLVGSKAVYNHALNPQVEPGTGTLEDLGFINEQNTTNYKKSKMDAYGQLWELLRADVTEEFLTKFKKLFLVVATPDLPLWYEEDEGE